MTEGKYKEKMLPLACLDSINYIPVISTPNRNLMLPKKETSITGEVVSLNKGAVFVPLHSTIFTLMQFPHKDF